MFAKLTLLLAVALVGIYGASVSVESLVRASITLTKNLVSNTTTRDNIFLIVKSKNAIAQHMANITWYVLQAEILLWTGTADDITANLNNKVQGVVENVDEVDRIIKVMVRALQKEIADLREEGTDDQTALADLLQQQENGVVSSSQAELTMILTQLQNLQTQLTTSVGTLTGTAQTTAQQSLVAVNASIAKVETLQGQLSSGAML
jgi:hypothetical protein